jgi:hypothetical protein
VVQADLHRRKDKFSAFKKGNELSLNGAKTQLLLRANVKKQAANSFEVIINCSIIKMVEDLELLEVRFDWQFTDRPHEDQLIKDARFRAAHMAGLANHLPNGPLLRQLSCGLLLGRLSHALPAVLAPRLPGFLESATTSNRFHQ